MTVLAKGLDLRPFPQFQGQGNQGQASCSRRHQDGAQPVLAPVMTASSKGTPRTQQIDVIDKDNGVVDHNPPA